jgi:dipeptidyl aminopeptidase/acylaminoacyl peptidase
MSSVEFSPDGKWLAYVVKDNERTKSVDLSSRVRTGIPVNANACDVWISSTETGLPRNLTGSKGENWLPKWSPDGQYLAFLSNRDGSGQAKLWVWDAAKDDLKKVSDVEVRADQIEWMRDGKRIITTVLPEGLSVSAYITEVEGRTGTHEIIAERAESSTVTIYRSQRTGKTDGESPRSDPWNLNSSLRDLASVEVATGKTSILVHGQRIEMYILSPDGSSVAYTASKRFESPGSIQLLFDLSTVNLATGKGQVIASDIPLAYDGTEFSWSPNSTLVSYHTGWTHSNDCYVVNALGGSPRNITHFSPMEAGQFGPPSVPMWDRNGHVYLLRDGALWAASFDQDKAVKLIEIPGRRIQDVISRSDNVLWTTEQERSAIVVTHDDVGKQDGFYKIDFVDRKATRLLERGQCYKCANLRRSFSVSPDGKKMAYSAEDAQHDANLWLSDVSFRNPRRLTSLNPQFDQYKLGTARLIDWLSDDGEQLHGALLLPSDYKEGTRYPLIVWVYAGGVLSDYFNRFGLGSRGPYNFQLLATRGYAVLLPDSPHHEEGIALADLTKTVLPGVNKTIDIGIADPKHIGVMGQSNGGYGTLALIVQTKRFQCAIEMQGVGDLIAFYGIMDKAGKAHGTGFERGAGGMGGPPWAFPERYIENSPVFYLNRVETPLLMVQGTADTTVPPFLGDEVFVGLRRLGKEVEYAKYEGEDHAPPYWSYPNQIDLCNRMIAWFDKYLRGEAKHPDWSAPASPRRQ